MRRHQVLTGAVNPGECCFAVGYIEGVPFTAYASGCDLVILASNFERVQIIPGEKHGNIQVGCIDCSSENGKIAASYANQVYIYEPVYQPGKKSHLKLDYQWNLSGSFKVESLVSNLSWNQDGSRILTGSDAIQIWSHPTPDSDAEESDQGEANSSKDTQIWESIWQTKTATPVYNLKYSSDGQFFASAGKSDRLVKIWYQVHSPQTAVANVNGVIEPKGENYSFIYLAHPRAVTGFSWRRTSKYLPRGTVANCLVTSCRDNICRVWRETLLPDINVISTSSKLTTGDGKVEAQSLYKRQHFSLGLKPRKKRRTPGANIPLSSVKHEHDLHKYYHGNKNFPNGYMGISIQVHFHIAATINPNTDIPLLPAIGTMSKGAAPNFVVNWLNNKELQFTLASEMLFQSTKDQGLIDTRTSGTDTTSQEMGSQESQSELDDDTDPSGRESTDGGSLDGGGIVINVPTQSPKSVQRPSSLETSPFSQKGLSDGDRDIFSPAVRAGFDALKREWQSSADMLYSIHPIDGSFLLWLVEWVDENIPGVHRQPLVSFSCRIPQAFPQFDATSLSGDLILYRSNLTLDHRVLERGRGIESPSELRAMTPSYSFVQKLSHVPEGTDIFAYTPKVSMLSKHSNGTLNQWEISFAEGSKFQTVLNVSHVNRSAGHRFQVNDLACHPVLPLLLTSSHHNIPKVDVDPDIATSRTRKSSVAARRASLAAKRGSVREPTGSFSLFGKNFLSQTEHIRLTQLYEANLENTAKDLQEKDEVVVPDEIMDKLHSEMNWPDMSAPTGLCSELILWKVFHVGPLCKVGGVVELARINSPFISSFSHVSWLPSLLPSSCLPLQSNSPSACFVASDGYSLRLFQAVIDARSLLNEITSTSNQYEGYLSSSSPITPYLLREGSEGDETPAADLPRVVSLQSTSRPGCIIELDKLSEAKQNWQNVQLMHTFHKQFITGQSKTSSLPSPPLVHSDPDIASFPSLHSNHFDECFYLVVIDRKDKGQSIINMWYIRLRTEISKSKVLKDVDDSSDDDDDSSVDARDGDSSDSTDVADSTQTSSSISVSQISTRLRTYSRRVCSQVLELPEGVEIVSASPAAGHLSSSCIYPACAAPYLLSTACSDGRLRFWTCRMEDGGSNAASPMMEGGQSSSSSDQSPSRTQIVDDRLARANYKWEEWELMVREDTQSDLKVKGKPVAVSCAYNGRIACAYRTDSTSASGDNRVPLEVSIHECESTGGSEWIHEDTINLGRLNLDKMEVSPDKHTTTPTAELGYKIMKRSSKVEDFLSLSDDQEERGHSQKGLECHNGTGQDWNVNKLPVQLAWASKEDGSHLLTVGLGSKVTIFTPNLHDEEDCKPKWTPLSKVKLSCVDGVAPFSRMLSWVRAGILVVGLENEMHVYSQWRNPEEKTKAISRESKSKSHARADSSRAISRNESLISVNLQSLPMSRSEREQSYNDVTQLAKDTTDVGKPDHHTVDGEEVDDGLFENSYKSCPVLPQYHPIQLMGLMNCGRINRVNAILSHLVRCIAGDDTVQRAISHGDTASQQSSLDLEEDDLKAFSRSLSLSTSPVETQPKETHSHDYIELVSVPPLPLYALLAADSSSSPILDEASRDRTSSISADYDEPSTVTATDYSKLFASGLESPHLSPDMFDTPPKENHNSDTIRRKMNNPSYFGPGQAKLLANYLTRMHLPGLSGQDQMHLLALADTLATTKTEITARGTGTAVTAIGREGAGYADLDNMDNSHAGETLDECGLRYLLAMKFYLCLIKSLPLPQQQQLKRQGLVSSHFIWAFHSEAEEELLSLLPSMQKGEPTWAELRAMGVGWWVRNNTTLRRCMEKVAKSQFQAEKNPLDAALFYLAMKKKTLLWGLFRSIGDEKMTQFFRNDFKQERWRKAALKNAFALLGRQRFEHAAAFFLLAGSLKDAVEVCLNNLEDIQLAMVISRLYEEDLEMPKTQKKIIYEEVLGCDSLGKPSDNHFPHKDPFLRSMAYWLLKDYIKALDTLLLPPSKLTKDNELNGQIKNRADVFNFYNYLRTHPLIVLRQSKDSEIAPSVSKVLAKSSAMDGGSADDEITPEERRLFFATAHMHASAGCPLLALEVLSHLPKVRQGNSEETSERTNGQLISSGTIDEGFMSKSTTGSSFKETASDFDWSKPSLGLTNGGGGAGSSVMDFDWSQPVGGRFDEKLELDWGDDPDEAGSNNGDDETMVTENGKGENGVANGDSEKLSVEEGEELCDIMAQQLKFTCCLKVMMEELRTLATGFEVHGGQLRYQLYVWLERQVETLKLLCNYGPFVQEQGERVEKEEDEDGNLENGPSSLHEMIQARRTDFEDKRQRALRRKRWLHDNHELIRTILNYSLLYGQNGGGLASVCMELVLLMQEVQQETKVSQQLSSPLPLPTTLPLLSASVASSKTVVADPVLHLRHLVHSILLAVLDFTAPPSPQRKSSTLPALSSLSAALSACIYQSLCDSDTYSSSVIKSKAAGMDVYAGGGANVLYRVGNLVSVNRKRRAPSGDVPLTVSSQPSKWPGVATLQALLSSEKDSDLPPMNIQLCEGLLSVYMTLLVRALSTHNTNELYRLMGHQLNERLWASVFGGGAKVRERKQATSQKIVPSNKSVSQQRNKYTLRLMGKASSGRNPTSTSEDKPVQREVFIAPETSIIDYFMVKPHIEAMQGDIDFDSEASDDSSLDDYYDDDEDEGAFGTRGSTLSSGKNQQDGCDQYSDPTSYSWCLLRYTTIRLVLQKLQTFLPSVGIELAELPVASPILHSILKLLEQWQKALMDRLDLFAGPPAEYLQQCYMVSPNPTMSGPSILRYKGLLEPSNTPFTGTSQAVRSVQRYWNFLVRQEAVQDVFIKYIFEKNKTEETDSAIYTDSGSEGRMKAPPSGKVRIIHKEQDRIPAFCFNQADWRNISLNGEFRSTPTTVVVSTHHGLMELDISMLLEPEVPYWLEEEEDTGVMSRSVSRNTDDDFLLMHTMDNSSSRASMIKTTSAPFINIPAAAYSDLSSDSLSGQTGRGTNVITQRQLPHVRCLAAHPSLPYYLSGSGDGSVHLWEWGHNQKLYTHRGGGQFPKVSQIRVNDQGNKFGVSDENGQLCLWQMGMNNPVVTKPYWSMQCHSKMASDFVFLGSSSFLATAGLSNDNKNICLWDTLMPKRKSMVHAFSCHDGGCPCIMYCPRQQTIISGSKRGEIALFDLRQRKIRQTFQAHESGIRSLAVSPCESFFVSGSAEGNIKVWSLEVHGLLHCFSGQHPKGSFFRPGTTGVLQLAVLQPNYLYSCGADGTLKWRTLPEHNGD